MKKIETYLPRKVFDQYVLLPVGQEIMRNKSIIKLNETGYIIAQTLIKHPEYDDALVALIKEVDASDDETPEVKASLDAFLDMLARKNITLS